MAVVMGDILAPLQLMNVATVAAVPPTKRALENRHQRSVFDAWLSRRAARFHRRDDAFNGEHGNLNPQDTFIGLALTALGLPVYLWLREGYDSSGPTP